jgi:hypothetical protein
MGRVELALLLGHGQAGFGNARTRGVTPVNVLWAMKNDTLIH